MITLFFRKKRESVFSIEELYASIIPYFPQALSNQSIYLPEEGAGLNVLLKNGLFAKTHHSAVNHITGEVHYLAFFLPKKRTILTIHDLRPLYRGSALRKFILKQLWFYGPGKAARYITVISEATRQDLLKHVSGIESKVQVIPNCLSSAFTYTPKPFETSKPRILHLGTKENKNLERLIQALENITCHLHIIGPLTVHQQELLNGSKVSYSNTFNLPFEGVIAEYKRADVVSFVSLQEGFGLPIIEAQAVGRPVITSNVSSMPEVAGEGALLVNPYSINEIRQGIVRIIEDDTYRTSLIAKGLKNIERYSPEVVAEQYAQLYRRVLAENK